MLSPRERKPINGIERPRLPAPVKRIRPSFGESKRNRQSSRVTLTRAFAPLQVFFMVASLLYEFNTPLSFSRKPYSFVELHAQLC
jgi:hypothetical protein